MAIYWTELSMLSFSLVTNCFIYVLEFQLWYPTLLLYIDFSKLQCFSVGGRPPPRGRRRRGCRWRQERRSRAQWQGVVGARGACARREQPGVHNRWGIPALR